MKEKRRIERYSLNLPARVSIPEKEDLHQLQAYTKDVSSGGTFLSIEQELEIGQKVNLELFLSIKKLQEFFEMDNQVRIEVTGEVIRHEEGGVGIRFDKKYTIFPFSMDNMEKE